MVTASVRAVTHDLVGPWESSTPSVARGRALLGATGPAEAVPARELQ